MKNKIIKILESPKVVIPSTLLVIVVAGFFVYMFVGYAPKVKDNDQVVAVLTDVPNNGETVDLAFPKGGRVSVVSVKIGDVVKKGQMLASLDSTDVRGALEIAKANYQKIINGATSIDVDVAKASVKSAEVNLDTVTKQQNLAVESAYRNLLNSAPEAVPEDITNDYVLPVISGTYFLGKEGIINLKLYHSSGGLSFDASGLVTSNGLVDAINPQPIGSSGLYIKFPSSTRIDVEKWVIAIPNKKASNYVANFNAYQGALESQKRLIAVAEASLDQANTILLQKVSNARPEDVASATGALQVAQGAYDNDFIYAPADGLVTSVNISVGEIASANSRVISLTVNK